MFQSKYSKRARKVCVPPNPYILIHLSWYVLFSYLLPSQPSRGKQKTGICRRTTSPRWEQTICWDDLTIEDVADRSLELAVWDHDRLGHQDFLGGARFNLGTGNEGFSHVDTTVQLMGTSCHKSHILSISLGQLAISTQCSRIFWKYRI